ncbi:UNVERIFIED_CONTAM: hypothetical protein FKN15_059867 [Acipenser sinensis]
MLEQILADMYIEPELLAELNEEQKQILFFKMREEQVRRWKEKEALLEKEQSLEKKSKKANEKSVKWLLGSDSDVWVWVMGEHLQDKTYDQICDDIMAERARQQAQREAEEIRMKPDENKKRATNKLVEGIISREEAEDLLSSKGQGSFLIRVSEKIMGYVLSYRCQDSFKHFLIDASEDSYCFLGVEQLVHSTLSDLVQYHKVEPITMMGREQLLEPCGQTGNCLDYSDLFQ